MTKPCIHCGEPAEDSDFCCLGCHTAYYLLKGAGLEAIYRQSDRKWKTPKEQAAQHFEHFNDSNFLEQRAPLKDGIREAVFPISGLMCAACIWVIEHLPQLDSNVKQARVDFGRGSVRIRWTDRPKALSQIADTLAKLGYEISSSEIDISNSRLPVIEWIRLGITGASTAGAMHIGLLLVAAHTTTEISPMATGDARTLGFFAAIAALPAVTFGAWPFFRTTYQNLKLRRLSADFLISLAVIWGYLTSLYSAAVGSIESYFDALSMIVFLLLVGRILIRLSTLKAVQRPTWFARRQGRMLPAESLSLESVIDIEKDDVVPADGRLLAEEAWLDQSAVTGESMPVRFVLGQLLTQGSQAKSNFQLKMTQKPSASYLERLSKKLQAEEWIRLLLATKSILL